MTAVKFYAYLPYGVFLLAVNIDITQWGRNPQNATTHSAASFDDMLQWAYNTGLEDPRDPAQSFYEQWASAQLASATAMPPNPREDIFNAMMYGQPLGTTEGTFDKANIPLIAMSLNYILFRLFYALPTWQLLRFHILLAFAHAPAHRLQLFIGVTSKFLSLEWVFFTCTITQPSFT